MTFQPKPWWQFWHPHSGPLGGIIAGGVILAIILVLMGVTARGADLAVPGKTAIGEKPQKVVVAKPRRKKSVE